MSTGEEVTCLDRGEGWAVGLPIETGGVVFVDWQQKNEGSLFVGVRSRCAFVIGEDWRITLFILWAL